MNDVVKEIKQEGVQSITPPSKTIKQKKVKKSTVSFNKVIPLPTKEIVKQFIGVSSFLMPEQFQLTPKEVDVLTEAIFLARKDNVLGRPSTNFDDPKAMNALYAVFNSKAIYGYRKSIVKKKWMIEQDNGIFLVGFLDKLVRRKELDITFNINFSKKQDIEKRFDNQQDT